MLNTVHLMRSRLLFHFRNPHAMFRFRDDAVGWPGACRKRKRDAVNVKFDFTAAGGGDLMLTTRKVAASGSELLKRRAKSAT
jgi:hypothetical protein